MLLIDNIVEIEEAKIFWGIYKNGKYLGAGINNYQAGETFGGLTSGYRNEYTVYKYDFPEGFVPKENTPYLCVEKLVKEWNKTSNTVVLEFLLQSPIEIGTYVDPEWNSYEITGAGGYCAKKKMVGHGYLSADEQTIYVTKTGRRYYPADSLIEKILAGEED
ncbi:hypothetical protein L1279_001140 [Planomicrobium sp. HSC-17F08]|nr:hypothetical protein [Planomicrobium sp. HSC-17F08]